MRSTPDLCDDYTLDSRVLDSLFFNFGGFTSFSGQLVTVKCFEDNSKLKELVASSGDGRVIVVDGGASKRCAYLGGQIALEACRNGWQGFVVNGYVRDVDELSEINIGIKALGSYPKKTNRLGAGEANVLISFAGVSFQPGDHLYSDNNGIIVTSKYLI
ncbi:MAG: ribonuclease activity regulator protein RraA [Porticoccaceae bacterium]|nr:ribonuclease activity regulator protein RraA [Porticoccaceae bacterium]